MCFTRIIMSSGPPLISPSKHCEHVFKTFLLWFALDFYENINSEADDSCFISLYREKCESPVKGQHRAVEQRFPELKHVLIDSFPQNAAVIGWTVTAVCACFYPEGEHFCKLSIKCSLCWWFEWSWGGFWLKDKSECLRPNFCTDKTFVFSVLFRKVLFGKRSKEPRMRYLTL